MLCNLGKEILKEHRYLKHFLIAIDMYPGVTGDKLGINRNR